MNKLLVHIITGVENPSRSVLGFLVAKSAIEDGNEVTIFCAGDGVTSLHEITTNEMPVSYTHLTLPTKRIV